MTISTDRQREILEGARTNAEEQAFGFRMEKRTQEQLLARATASKLRLGRYTPKGDMAGAAAAIKQRLAQLEFDIERLEVVVADIDEQLAALPVEESDE
jgi:hypothetical protein